MSTLSTLAYWVTRPGEGELRDARVAANPARGHSLLRAEVTAVSPGTERLVGLGLVPASCRSAMACRYMEGDFALPVKYGYCFVGTGIAGSCTGQRVFVMHPHQGLAVVDDTHVTPLPDALPTARAALIPGTETALNAVWDAEMSPGERALVVGGGLVGLLVAFVLAARHDRPAAVVESDASRRRRGAGLAWVSRAIAPDEIEPGSFDVAFHTSGSGAGLQAAIDAVGFEGRVIELSWYGSREVTLQLGTHFHYQRKRILASQVGHLAPIRRAAGQGPTQRLADVIDLLDEPRLDALLGPATPLPSMPALMRDVYRGRCPAALPLIEYDS